MVQHDWVPESYLLWVAGGVVQSSDQLGTKRSGKLLPAPAKNFFTKGAETGHKYQTLYGISLHSQRQVLKHESGSHEGVDSNERLMAR